MNERTIIKKILLCVTGKILRLRDLIIKFIKNPGDTTVAYSWIAQLDCGDGGGGCGL